MNCLFKLCETHQKRILSDVLAVLIHISDRTELTETKMSVHGKLKNRLGVTSIQPKRCGTVDTAYNKVMMMIMMDRHTTVAEKRSV